MSKDVAFPPIQGLTGQVSDVQVAVPASEKVQPLRATTLPADIDLKRMAQWAMNYLIRTPRPQLDYEPVFQCHPLRCPPSLPADRHDPIVPCDTDARMNWEWYYMRDISQSTAGKDIEVAFHKRMLDFVEEDGTVWCHPGAGSEDQPNRQWKKEEYTYHVWGAHKILHAMAEDYRRTGNEQSKAMARRIMIRLKKLAVYPTPDKCYFRSGNGVVQRDGTPVPGWANKHPSTLVEPLVNYYLATGDKEALDFARAYAEGIIAGSQPGVIPIGADGSFAGGHSHITLHGLWGVAHFGMVTGEAKYVEFVKRSFDWMLTQGTGTGWFPAAPGWAAGCNETCCTSDMMSIAALIGQAGHPEYFDYVERYLRNYISNLQFIITPQFEAYYRKINAAAGEENIRKGLDELQKFQGGVIGGSGLNDYENELLGGTSGFEMFGCCAPEGMRAIYTVWSNTIDRRKASGFGPGGVYVTMSFNRQSSWGTVVSFMPREGRLTVRAAVNDAFFLRPPHWATEDGVLAFVGTRRIPTRWEGQYVAFDAKTGDELTITYPLVRFTHRVEGLWKSCSPNLKMTFQWCGNMVTSCDPAATKTPLFTGSPRQLPQPPDAVLRP